MGQKNSVGQPKSSGGSSNHVVNNTSTNVIPVEENHQHQDLEADSHQYLDYPFLRDETTLNYLSGSKTMFIMRGLPGSGKSCIANAIHTTYKNSVICSADDYFICNEKYEFDRDKLNEAHISCKDKAKKACEDNINVVVIDNTNIRQWEMEYYFDLAKETCYCVVLVEPHTSWKFSPQLLAGKNKHNVGVELLAARISQWEVVIPLYFGWYLNEADSHILSLVGMAHLEECLQVPAFLEDFKDFSKLTDISKLLRYYSLPKSCPGGMLHCTAKFCLGGKVPGSSEYASKEEVVDSCGRSYPLQIVGLLMTPRTFGARVKLEKEQLTLWGTSLASSGQFEPSFHPTSGTGSKAHVTLGCAEGVEAVTTGLDLEEIVACESEPDIGGSCPTYTLQRVRSSWQWLEQHPWTSRSRVVSRSVLKKLHPERWDDLDQAGYPGEAIINSSPPTSIHWCDRHGGEWRRPRTTNCPGYHQSYKKTHCTTSEAQARKPITLVVCQRHHLSAIKLTAPQSPTYLWAIATSKLAKWSFGPALCTTYNESQTGAYQSAGPHPSTCR
uniref:2',3'-cyclic-nucleotide 3'-phosphodiesterase n=1 Tax=Timema tahoe TaxID=61484 RepID=A0A7R9FKI6_9NEOP|nr:unnamed protein product [Timema tahoe]